jgi:hypothetical protein
MRVYLREDEGSFDFLPEARRKAAATLARHLSRNYACPRRATPELLSIETEEKLRAALDPFFHFYLSHFYFCLTFY